MADPMEVVFSWYGWDAEVDLENDDDRKDVWYLTITEYGEELATIVHRTCPDANGVEKYPLDGPVAESKINRAKRIASALNAQHAIREVEIETSIQIGNSHSTPKD